MLTCIFKSKCKCLTYGVFMHEHIGEHDFEGIDAYLESGSKRPESTKDLTEVSSRHVLQFIWVSILYRFHKFVAMRLNSNIKMCEA